MRGRAFSLDLAGLRTFFLLGVLMALLSPGGLVGQEIAGREHRPVLAEDGCYHGLGLRDTGTESLDPSRMAPAIEIHGQLPSAVDNSAGLPPVGDQGSQGSCGAWSVGYYLKTYAEGKEHGWSVGTTDHQFSPAYIYNQARIPPDGGMWFNDTMLLVERFGCPTLSTMPYSQADYTSWPTEAAYKEGILYRNKNHYWVKTMSQDGLNQVKAHIAAGNIGLLAIYIYNNFRNISSYGNSYCISDRTGNNSGGHAVTIVGYDDAKATADGVGAFRCVNQWGTDWGDAGFFWISYQAVTDSSNRICQGWYGYIEELSPDNQTYAATFQLSYGRFRALEILLQSSAGEISLFNFRSYEDSRDLAIGAPQAAIWVDLTHVLPTVDGAPVTLQVKNLDPSNGISGQIASFSLFRFSDGSKSQGSQVPTTIPADGGTASVTAPFAFAGNPLTCTAAADPASGAAPLAVNFTGSASGGAAPYTYTWDFNDGGTSTQKDPAHTFNAAGTYQVKLTVRDSAGAEANAGVQVTATAACTVTCEAAFPAEVEPFTAVNYSCTYQASGCSGAPSFQWDFGDGQTSNAQNGAFSYQAVGTYTWSLTVTVDGTVCRRGGTVVVSATCPLITVVELPQDQTIQAGQSATLSVTATCDLPLHYQWYEGKSMDWTHPIEGARGATYQTPPLYESKQFWVEIGNTCRAIFPKEATITVIPGACSILSCTASANPTSGAPPLSITFAASTTTSGCSNSPAFQWSFGDGASATGYDAVHTYTTAGTYDWTMTATVEGQSCVRTGRVTVTGVSCAVTCEADLLPDSGPAPLDVFFFATVWTEGCTEGPSYAWNFGDGATAGVANPDHVYSSPGIYTWTFTGAANGVSCTKTGTVTVTGGIPGDCDGDGSVSIGEVQKAINMFLGLQAPGCGADCNGDGQVSIGELQKVINAFLGIQSSC